MSQNSLAYTTSETWYGASRTRSIWLWQLVLAAAVVVITLAILAVDPRVFGTWTLPTGIALIVITTLVTLVIPWHRVPKRAVIVLPFVDIFAIGIMGLILDLRFSYLWVFPLAWIATYYSIQWMLASFAAVTVAITIDAINRVPSTATTLRFVIVLLCLAFISTTIHVGARKTWAFKTLLHHQSERLAAQADLARAQQHQVTQMINGLEEAVARIDRQGQIIQANSAYVTLYGLDPADLGRPATAVEYDDRNGVALPTVDRTLDRAARGEIFDARHLWLFDTDGQWHALSASTRSIQSSHGEDMNTMLVVRDVTEAIEAEQAKHTMTTTVTHELANPLTAIIGYADLLLEGDLSPDVRRKVELIDAASSRMERLIAEVLRTGGESLASAAASRRPVDVRDLLADSVDAFGPAAAARNLTLVVKASTPLVVLADVFRLRQVFDNLLSNALKYTPREGKVNVSAHTEADNAVITIRDTGIGIGRDDLSQVFDDYFRTEAARESGAAGTGLGLGIARSIISDHTGTVSIFSTPGHGTTVITQIPLANPVSDN